MSVQFIFDFLSQCLFLGLSFVTGYFFGILLKRRLVGRGRPMALVVSIAAAIPLVAFETSVMRLMRIGLWDAFVLIIIAVLGQMAGAFAGKKAFHWKNMAVAAASLALSLIFAEIIVGIKLPHYPIYYTPEAGKIRFAPYDNASGRFIPQTLFDLVPFYSNCSMIYWENDKFPPSPFPNVTDAGRVVLHIGDSMVEGPVVGHEEKFTRLLEKTGHGVRHLNLGQAGTAPDYYLLVARRWAPATSAGLVVVHLFLGNDLLELNKLYPCCNYGPLLKFTNAGVEQRCPTARWPDGFGESLAWFAAVSPPPALVRIFTPFSQFARHMTSVIHGLSYSRLAISTERFQAYPGNPAYTPGSVEDQLILMEKIMRSMRDDMEKLHAGLAISILPPSEALENTGTQETAAYKARRLMLEMLARLNVEALDPWDFLESLVKKEGRDAVFLPQGNTHFNPNGHRHYADWLIKQLGPRMGVN